jgi:hypothetical protein
MLGTRVHGGHGVGAELVARTGAGPVGFADTMVITEWDPPHRCVVRHTGRVVRGSGSFEVIDRGHGSEFRWIERLELLRLINGRAGRAIIRPLAQWGLDASLRRFARYAASVRPGRDPAAGDAPGRAAKLTDLSS